MSRKSQGKSSSKWTDNICLKEVIGCIVVLGFLIAFIVVVVRLPSENLLEVFRTAAAPLAIVIVSLFGSSNKKKDGKG